ncbi:MAG TPA: nuclear transport factor 2 family protein [Dehalococcoidia bacterium]|nr:nuclear transport factor 2 family protein [Dehalococcoidia bacterium]
MTTHRTKTDEELILAAMDGASEAFRRGDASGFEALYSRSDDVTLFGAQGGCVRGRADVDTIGHGAASALGRGGSSSYEVLALRVSGDLAYVAAKQRIQPPENHSDVGIVMRVTQVFAREAGVWRLLHRHADRYEDSPFGAPTPQTARNQLRGRFLAALGGAVLGFSAVLGLSSSGEADVSRSNVQREQWGPAAASTFAAPLFKPVEQAPCVQNDDEHTRRLLEGYGYCVR